LEKIFVKTCSWLGFTLLILCIFSALFDISIFESSFIVFYSLSLLGFIIGFMGWILLKFHTLSSVTKIVGKVGFYGNLVIMILFFPPISHVWGTLIFGP
jgi:hypothetical protein